MKDEFFDKITIGFFAILLILATIMTIAFITKVPTKRTYKVYNDRNNFTIVEE